MIGNSQAGRLRLLCLGPQNVWPPVDGGKEGIYGALQGLAKKCDVVYAFPDLAFDQVQGDGYVLAGVTPLPVPWVVSESLAQIFAATVKLRPYKFEKYSSRAAVNHFARAIGDRPFDAIVCFHAHTARLGAGLRFVLGLDVPVLVREHNIEYELVASYRKSRSAVVRFLSWPIEFLTRRAELDIWKGADAVAFLSDRDLLQAQSASGGGRLILAREGVPLPGIRSARFPGTFAPLLVLLNPRANQSVHNLIEFIRGSWSNAFEDPRTMGITLDVTGVTTEQLAKLLGIELPELQRLRVRGLGFLPSLAAVLSNALALVSPTYVGGGIRKKILEAMANQLPVIATRFDIATCDYFETGTNILELYDDVERFCQTVGDLRNNPDRWVEMSSAGRAAVETYASWDLFAETILGEIIYLRRLRSKVELSGVPP